MKRIGPATIGLIGFGALAQQILTSFEGQPIRWIVLLREGSTTDVPAEVTVVRNLEDLVAARPHMVVEAAGQQSVAAFVPTLLQSGIPVAVASVGALADETTAAEIAAARRMSGTRLIIPSGAIGGLDYLAAVACLPDTRVKYRLKKPVAAWRAELEALGLSQTTEPVTLFEGTPAEAARRHPKNLNAAFTAALTVQPARTVVAVIADPALTTNVHEIEVESTAGEATFRFSNAPSPGNPKTSFVTALSLVAAVSNFLDEGGTV